jgi:hypothetical protein
VSAAPRSAWHAVIVNYRTGELAVRSARAAREAIGPSGTVTVVDSASGDDSVALLSAEPGVDVCALGVNRGFGAALNAGARRSDSAYFLCMNADVEIAGDLCIQFEARFGSLSTLGIIGPRLVGKDGTAQPSARLFPTHASLLWSRRSPLRRWLPTRGRRYLLPEPPSFTLCDVVAGACFAVRRSVWDSLGGMDEHFFLYLEDTDLCRRAKVAGWLVGYEPAVHVAHTWGASTKQSDADSRHHHAQSLVRYFRKHHADRPIANTVLALATRIARFPAR